MNLALPLYDPFGFEPVDLSDSMALNICFPEMNKFEPQPTSVVDGGCFFCNPFLETILRNF